MVFVPDLDGSFPSARLLELKLFNPRVEILPPAQRTLWAELRETPYGFVLYGGTGLALRLGHRSSEDFDFFSNDSFETSALLQEVKYLRNARIDQRGDNTLTAVVDRVGPVKLSFFGDVQMNHVQEPDLAIENNLQVASLVDLAATTLRTIQQRAEAKDYLDIAAALKAGVTLSEALAAGNAVYGKTFNVMVALKALTYFEDGNLPNLSVTVQEQLRKTALEVKLDRLPQTVGRPGITRRDSSQ
jgi:hypothetical protein